MRKRQRVTGFDGRPGHTWTGAMLAPSTAGVHRTAGSEIQNTYDSQCGFLGVFL